MSRRLRAAGHRTTFVARQEFAERVTKHGEAFVGLKQDHDLIERMAADPRPTLARPLALLRWLGRRRRLRLESIRSDELGAIIRALEPDLLLIDVEMHAAVIATAVLELPVLLTMVFFSVFRRSGLPPLHFAMSPGRTRSRRFVIACAWVCTRLGAVAKRARRRLSRPGMGDFFRPVASDTVSLLDLRALARQHGYPLRTETDRSQWLRPYAYRRLPLLCYNAWEMELPHDPSPVIHYVGPMVRTQRAEPPLDDNARHRWDELKHARAQAEGEPRPLIYCSLGTYWAADVRFLRTVLDVFVRRGDWDLVLGLGGTLSAGALAPIPANALVLEWAPQLEILQHADGAVTHGGATSLSECVSFGVPMVVYSTKHVDQNGNAARAAYHGVGVVGDKDVDGPPELERNLERVLFDPDIRQNVAAMREHFRAYEDADRAVMVVERFLKPAR